MKFIIIKKSDGSYKIDDTFKDYIGTILVQKISDLDIKIKEQNDVFINSPSNFLSFWGETHFSDCIKRRILNQLRLELCDKIIDINTGIEKENFAVVFEEIFYRYFHEMEEYIISKAQSINSLSQVEKTEMSGQARILNDWVITDISNQLKIGKDFICHGLIPDASQIQLEK